MSNDTTTDSSSLNKAKTVNVVRQAVFEYFAALASQLLEKLPVEMLKLMISPLHKVIEASSEQQKQNMMNMGGGDSVTSSGTTEDENSASEATAILAQEVLDLLSKVSGMSNFATAYNSVRAHVQGLRMERRKRRAIEAVRNPHKKLVKRLKQNKRKAQRRKDAVQMQKIGQQKKSKVSNRY